MKFTHKQRKHALARKGERLIRLAYQLEHEASAMRYMGFDAGEADSLNSLASMAGKLGRGMRDRAESMT